MGEDMDKIKIGIPRGLFYEEFHEKWKCFFEHLDCEVIESKPTNLKIIQEGKKLANDEMCLSFQVYLGHVASLKGQVDYVIVPRVDNYGNELQTCTNLLASYDIVHNLIDIPILNYNIDLVNHETEKKGFYQIARSLGKQYQDIKKAYRLSKKMAKLMRDKEISRNYNKISKSGLKLLLVGHSYMLHDSYFMSDIEKQIESQDGVLIYSDLFDSGATLENSKKYSHELYWKSNKEAIGAIGLLEHQLDGVIFISSFPCGPDSLVNELVMRKLNLPYLNLVMDDMNSSVGIETRIESFVDMINDRKK